MQAAETARLRGLLLRVLHRELAPEQIAPGNAQTLAQLAERQTFEEGGEFVHDSGSPQSNQGPTPATTAAPSTASQTMVIGMNTFQPRRMIWS